MICGPGYVGRDSGQITLISDTISVCVFHDIYPNFRINLAEQCCNNIICLVGKSISYKSFMFNISTFGVWTVSLWREYLQLQ